MTPATPSPMPTPNLAGLLRKPARITEHPTNEPSSHTKSNVQVEPVAEAMLVDPPSTRNAALQLAAQTATLTVDSAMKRPRVTEQTAKLTDSMQTAPVRQYLRSIAVYLPRSLHQALRLEAARANTTATALMLAAVNRTYERITEGLALDGSEGEATEFSPSSVASRDLFTVPQARRATEPTVQTTIRVTDSQHQVLNTLAAEHGIARSTLLAAALRLYIAGPIAS